MGILDLFRRTPAQPPQVRRFDGAAGGRRGFGIGSFGRTGTETMLAGPTLRNRARYAAASTAPSTTAGEATASAAEARASA